MNSTAPRENLVIVAQLSNTIFGLEILASIFIFLIDLAEGIQEGLTENSVLSVY